jgi:hypothetical protein
MSKPPGRPPGPDEKDLVAAIKAGKTRQIIVIETGVSVTRLNYIAEKYRLTIVSRYHRLQPAQGYWRGKLGRQWGKRTAPAEQTEEMCIISL